MLEAGNKVKRSRLYHTLPPVGQLELTERRKNIAMTMLRAVVGGLLLGEVLAKRDQINQVVCVKMDEVTTHWDIKAGGEW